MRRFLVAVGFFCLVPACIDPGITPGLERLSAAPDSVEATEGPTTSERIAFIPGLVLLKPGDVQNLAAETELTGSTPMVPTDFFWISRNPRVAYVTEAGVVIAVAPGSTSVRVIHKRAPGKALSVEVLIQSADLVSAIAITSTPDEIPVGGTAQFKGVVTLNGGERTDNVIWSSSDDTVATVGPYNGKVSVLRKGPVSITAAYAVNSQYRSSVALTITDAANAPGGSDATAGSRR